MAEGISKVVGDDDPYRCQAVTAFGQCKNRHVGFNNPNIKNAQYCLVHGGSSQQQAEERKQLRNYQIGKYQALLEKHAESPVLKSLRDEVAVLRMVLEQRLSMCTDITDLILQASPISEMVMKIEKVVTACNKLDSTMGQYMDKTALVKFASGVIDIITSHIADSELVNNIANDILKLATDE